MEQVPDCLVDITDLNTTVLLLINLTNYVITHTCIYMYDNTQIESCTLLIIIIIITPANIWKFL